MAAYALPPDLVSHAACSAVGIGPGPGTDSASGIFRPNARFYTGHKDGHIRVWETDSWACVAAIRAHKDCVTALEVLARACLAVLTSRVLRGTHVAASVVLGVALSVREVCVECRVKCRVESCIESFVKCSFSVAVRSPTLFPRPRVREC